MGFSKHLALIAAAFALLVSPGLAVAADDAARGCAALDAAADRAECVSRAHARDAARAAVQERLASDAPFDPGATAGAGPEVTAPSAPRIAAWDSAIEEASGVHPDELIEPRIIAFIVGVVWLVLLVRGWYRRQRRKFRRSVTGN